MKQAKEITPEEARYLFMKHIADMVNYWDKESRAGTNRERLEGLAFSILVTIDGGSSGLPGYTLSPLSRSDDDIRYAKENGFDYYPKEPMDIAEGAALHEEFHEYTRGEISRPENLYDFGAFLAEDAKQMPPRLLSKLKLREGITNLELETKFLLILIPTHFER